MVRQEPIELVYSLVGFPQETEWLEFKVNNADPTQIGRDISALANAAAWLGRDASYKVWGVDDHTHELVGTSFDPFAAKGKGSQSLQIWLKTKLTANANFEFDQFDHEGKRYVVLTVRPAIDQPVCFDGKAYVREGSSTTRLEPGSARESELWRRLQRSNFEGRVAMEDVAPSELDELLVTNAYFDLLGIRRPSDADAALVPLLEQGVIRRQDNGLLSISNLGALLIGKRVTAFHGLVKRPLRVLRFAGKGNREILEDRTFDEGYALALPAAEEFLMSILVSQEVSDGAFRRVQYAYPRKAVRELLANAVIHQDLSITDQGPVVCVYKNRIEFHNPGASLIKPERVLNAQPKTRNNALVGLLRQMDLCEEGGTGWDLAVAACEEAHMLSPRMDSDEESGTCVTLFAGSAFARMTKRERLDAMYWHCCLRYADGEGMSNQSLRERFGLPSDSKASLAMSRLIREGCSEGRIKVEDEDAGTKNRRYVPAWA